MRPMGVGQKRGTKMATMRQRIEELGIRASLEWADANPHMDGMPAGSTHWKVTLRRKGGRRMTVYFSMGPAHTSEPEAAEVLDCLASDASGYDNARSFEDWCSEYGYDSDSRKAERTYKTIEKQREKLFSFLGDDYDKVLFHTDRL
jgi:hypothetical protein